MEIKLLEFSMCPNNVVYYLTRMLYVCTCMYMRHLAPGFIISSTQDAIRAKAKSYTCSQKAQSRCYVLRAITKFHEPKYFQLPTTNVCTSCLVVV